MTLRTKFMLFAVAVHALLIFLAYHLLLQNKYLFLGLEVLVLVSVVLTVQLYRAFFKPLKLIRSGIESIRDKDFSTKFVPVGQQDLDELVEVYNHMIDQLRQERVAQAEKHQLLEKVILASPGGIVLLGFDNYIERVNPAAERLFQLPTQQLMGKHLKQLPLAWAQELAELQDGEARIFRINGVRTYRVQRAFFMDRGFQHNFIVLEELTEAILKNERQAYEKVIRMMSHEVNNSTGAINSILDSLNYYAPQIEPEHRQDYEQALQVAIDRNANLGRFMANFANVVRLPPPHKAPVNINELLLGLERLLHPTLQQRHIHFRLDLSKEPLLQQVDLQQMEQVLLNILKNALEAVSDGGTITVHTQLQPPLLTITDNGGGIPEDVRPRLFTPFFSTKETGQGIGLTMVRDILVNHGYQFSLETSSPGCTTFSINF